MRSRILVFIFAIFLLPGTVQATSRQAYADYQYQFSRFRTKLSEFQTAYSTYKQYGSLASEQEALTRIQQLIPQRNLATKTYFLYLNERLLENPGISQSKRGLWQVQITGHTAFLDTHSARTGSITTFDDARTLDNEYTVRYLDMQAGYRQVIAAIQLGYLSYFSDKYTQAAARAQALAEASRGQVTPQKQALFDRWLLALTNQHSLYLQKAKTIEEAVPKIKGSLQTQNQEFTRVSAQITQAREYLIDGISYLGELEQELKYE